MSKIIKEREYIEKCDYSRDFTNKDFPDSGWTFPCEADGTLKSDLTATAIKNCKACFNNPDYIDEGVVKHEWGYYEPAILKCDCGEEIEMENQYMGAFECPKCSQWYNIYGQHLNNPSTWREGSDW